MARKPSQLTFYAHPAFRQFKELSYGGDSVHGRRRRMRPLDRRRAVHVVLRSSRARGAWSLARRENARKLERILGACTRRHSVNVIRHATVGNHLHLLLRFDERRRFQAFLRAFSGWLARDVTGARKGRPMAAMRPATDGPGRTDASAGEGQRPARARFWDSLAFTRVVEFGRDLRNAYFYVLQNELEAEGVWDRRGQGSLARRFARGSGLVMLEPG